MLRKILKDTVGGTAIEYALVASVISVAAIGAFMLLGDQSDRNMSDVKDKYAAVN
ncbi:MAG: Flp family type IVb pilin [Sphingomonadales bacterium]|nr:Flp family type IVb pilin [Sphingomonadales bacterium]MBD3774674.1 Flp family type IVb pilin [Paracoccaceae bacterium]